MKKTSKEQKAKKDKCLPKKAGWRDARRASLPRRLPKEGSSAWTATRTPSPRFFKGTTPHGAVKPGTRPGMDLPRLRDRAAREFTKDDLFLMEAGSNSFEIHRRLLALVCPPWSCAVPWVRIRMLMMRMYTWLEPLPTA